MTYLIIAYDGTDIDAPRRRAAARPAHLEGAAEMKRQNIFIEGGAILNDEGIMVGSMMLVEFDSEANLQRWLQTDPYVRENVWESIRVHPFRRVAF